MSEIELTPLFSQPLYTNRHIKCDNDYIISQAEKMQWEKIGYADDSDTDNMYITTTLNVLTTNLFEEIKNIIEENVNIYLKDIFNCYDSFYIHKSWFLKAFGSGRNTMSDWHFHKDAAVSGVYYPYVPEGSGDIQFSNAFSLKENVIPSKEFNVYNSTLWSIKPTTGTLLLFPGYTLHRVEKSRIKNNRYSLAFDIKLNNE